MEEDLVVLEEFFKDRMDVEEEKWALERLSKTFRLLNSKLIHLSDEEYKRVIENAQKDFIPISVIQNKIDELDNKGEHYIFNEKDNAVRLGKIQVLQELLEERNK